jgi:hypothetical protein
MKWGGRYLEFGLDWLIKMIWIWMMLLSLSVIIIYRTLCYLVENKILIIILNILYDFNFKVKFDKKILIYF